ncbi:ankyrin repeat-containing protein [Anaeramoeba flamelloides]|uniref:Ankyrin repeat-containing protein n=1 Tax=Anaeramoeba flamelloides TaxID=1746091 RepID=A0AAV7ZEC6_9EUKA|nr:ankyrin repeat-containing protein [Anaeramoeba flamelloides]
MNIYQLIKKGDLQLLSNYFKKDENFDRHINDEPPLIHYTITNKASQKVLVFLISIGFDPDIRNLSGENPIHIAIKNGLKKNIIDLLIISGADVNSENRETPLHYACKYHANLDVLITLLKNDAKPNMVNNLKNSPLHYCSMYRCDIKMIKTLIDTGASLNLGNNNMTCLHYECSNNPRLNVVKLYLLVNVIDDNLEEESKQNQKEKKILHFVDDNNARKVLNSYQSIMEDMLQLFEKQEGTDFEIQCSDNPIKVHKIILQFRIGSNLEDFVEMAKYKKEKEIKMVIKWIYSGMIENKEKISKLCEEIGIKNFLKKSSKKGLLKDLKKLYNDEQSKDFRIIIKGKEIPVHKCILQARSNLFRNILNNEKGIEKCKDYSEKGFETVRIIMKYFYTDKIKNDEVNPKIIEELSSAIEHYQLNNNSSLKYILEKLVENYYN